jgi:hypothetical protein
MLIKNAEELVVTFMKMKEMDILRKFAALSPNSMFVETKPQCYSFCFVPGTRPDRALLVAHVDTVWNDSKHISPCRLPDSSLLVSENRYRGLTKKDQTPIIGGFGIGADDRAGVAILWELRNLGHSLLLVNGEESGCLGSSYLMAKKKRARLMQQHQFAVEFDRKGKNDLVFYQVGSLDFVRYCERSTGYKMAEGSFTDICLICQEICGVNISVGYKNEHTSNELLSLNKWNNTLEVSRQWLSQPSLPRFIHG